MSLHKMMPIKRMVMGGCEDVRVITPVPPRSLAFETKDSKPVYVMGKTYICNGGEEKCHYTE